MNRSADNPNANEPAAALAGDPTSRNIASMPRMRTDASAAPPHHRRRASLLDAASALASLGGSANSLGTARSPHAGEGAGRGKGRTDEDASCTPAYRGDDLPMTFPEKLMDMLSNEAVSDIITWLPNGKGFVILMKRRFAEEVLPLYFKQSKYTSFTRKLNRWGFQRMTTGPEIGAYSHPNFQRGNHLLCCQIHCTSKPPAKSKASAKRPTSPEGGEPCNPSRSPSTHEGSVKSDVGRGIEFDEVLLRQRQHLRALHLSSMQRMEEESARAHGRHGYNEYIDALYGGKERQSFERGTLHDESSFSYQRTPKYEHRSRHSELELGRLEFSPDGFKRMTRGQSVPPKKRHHEHNMAYKHSLPVFNARERRHLSAPTEERSEALAYSSYQDSLHRDVLSSMRARLAGIYESNKRTEDALKIDKQTGDALKNDKRAEDASKKTDSLYSVYWSELGKRRVFSTSPPSRALPSYKKNVRRASAA